MAINPARLTVVMSEVMKLVAQLPEDDQQLKRDSLEGETDFYALLDRVAEIAIADARLVELGTERLKRIEKRADRHREIIKRMMEVAGEEKIERPLFTASIGYRKPTPVITDPTLLPEAFVRRSPDMRLIARALQDGAVPGAEQKNPQPVLTLRTA